MRRLARAVIVALSRRPLLLYGAIDLGAAAGARLPRRRAGVDLRRPFPQLTPADAERVRRDLYVAHLKSRALSITLGDVRGEPRYPVLLDEAPARSIRAPAILLTFHMGPFPALAPVLRALPGRVLTLHNTPGWRMPAALEAERVADGVHTRVAAAVRAAHTLRAGDYVFVIADHPLHGTVEVPVLGGTVPLCRGPFALARLTGAPIVPLAARWERARVRVTVGRPFPRSEDEDEMAACAARFIEGILREDPAAAAGRLLAELMRDPAPEPAHGAAR